MFLGMRLQNIFGQTLQHLGNSQWTFVSLCWSRISYASVFVHCFLSTYWNLLGKIRMHVLHSLPPQPVLVDLFYGFPAAALGISICSTLWDPSLPIYSNMQKSLKTYKNNTYFPVHTCLTKVEATGERCCRKLIFMTLTIHMIYSVYAECTYSDHTYDSCIRMSFRQKESLLVCFFKKTIYLWRDTFRFQNKHHQILF